MSQPDRCVQKLSSLFSTIEPVLLVVLCCCNCCYNVNINLVRKVDGCGWWLMYTTCNLHEPNKPKTAGCQISWYVCHHVWSMISGTLIFCCYTMMCGTVDVVESCREACRQTDKEHLDLNDV